MGSSPTTGTKYIISVGFPTFIFYEYIKSTYNFINNLLQVNIFNAYVLMEKPKILLLGELFNSMDQEGVVELRGNN